MTTKSRLNIAIILALAGVLATVVLLVIHVNPDTGVRFPACGSGFQNSCMAVSLSSYGTVLGFPVAGIGLAYFLLFLFVLLLADYAGGGFATVLPLMLLPPSVLALCADIFLAVVMFRLGTPCPMCISTYIINGMIVILLALHLRQTVKNGESIKGSIKEFFVPRSSEGKAALASMFLFTLFLLFSVYTTVTLMEKGSELPSVTNEEVDRFINDFYSTPAEKLELPDTPLVIGDPDAPVEIIAFTDFLCTACSELYRLERIMSSMHRGQVRFRLYHYPMDSECNRDIRKTRYKNACIASRAFTAAAMMSIKDEYTHSHYGRIKSERKRYTLDTAMMFFTDAAKRSGIDVNPDEFRTLMESRETADLVKRHIEAAIALHINATPTLFIKGHRIEGLPPYQYIDRIVRTELAGGM